MDNIFSLIFKTIIMYFAVTTAMRFMGKRQVGELSTAEIAVTLLISEVATMPIGDDEVTVWHGLISIAILVFLEIIVSYFDMKFSFIMKLSQGKPTVVIKDGKILENALKKSRLTLTELNEELRLKNTNMKDVYIAIIETNGQLSIIPKNQVAGVTRQDLSISVNEDPIDFAVIIDGEIKERNIELAHQTKKFVEMELKKKHVNLKDVFAMYADSNGVTYFQKKLKK